MLIIQLSRGLTMKMQSQVFYPEVEIIILLQFCLDMLNISKQFG